MEGDIIITQLKQIRPLELDIKLTILGKYQYGARGTESRLIDKGVQRIKDYSKSNTPERSIACYGFSFRGLLRELAYDISLSGILKPFNGISEYNPTRDRLNDYPHIFYRLFGCRGLEGKLRITDGKFESTKYYQELEGSEPIEIRTNTSLSYGLNANKKQSLFSYEVAMIDEINYKVIGYNLNQAEKLFLLAILMRLPEHTIAGKGSTGSGIIWKASGFDAFKEKYLSNLKEELKEKK